MTKEQTNDWEKDFNNKWKYALDNSDIYVINNPSKKPSDSMKQYILDVVAQEKEKLAREIDTYITQNESWDSDPNLEQMVVPSKGLRKLLQK